MNEFAGPMFWIFGEIPEFSNIFIFLGFRTVEGWRGSTVLFFGTVKGWRGSGNFGSGTSLLNTGIFRIFSQICSENFENFGQKIQICPENFVFF